MKNLVAVMVAAVLVSGCAKPDPRYHGDASEEANVMLTEMRLLELDSVRVQAGHFNDLYRAGTMTKEDAATELVIWIRQYARRHPDEVRQVVPADRVKDVLK